MRGPQYHELIEAPRRSTCPRNFLPQPHGTRSGAQRPLGSGPAHEIRPRSLSRHAISGGPRVLVAMKDGRHRLRGGSPSSSSPCTNAPRDYSRDMGVPEPHRVFLENAVRCLKADERLLGVAVAGSWTTGEMDRFSDLDLVIAVVDEAFDAVMHERPRIARGLGAYLAGFTGEHVGEPRVFICLYGPPLLHVDLKFVRISDFHLRVEDPEVVWERSCALTEMLKRASAHWPPANLQWMEDRFWIWVHYGACKIGRGELFEAIDFVAFLRTTVLGPLALTAHGHLPRGVRKLETNVPELLEQFVATVATHDAGSCAAALEQAANFYRQLRDERADESLERRLDAERNALAFLAEIRADVTRVDR